MKNIRVLVVDDSAFLRRAIPRILESHPEIEVIGTASNGQEALEKIKELQPDVITLDVVMPVMDGLTALKIIMRDMPTPVIMVSSLTTKGAKETLEALSLGAVDFISKPSGQISLDIDTVSDTLLKKIKAAYVSKVKIASQIDVTRQKFRDLMTDLSTGKVPPATIPTKAKDPVAGRSLVAIATSTGGPAALQMLLPGLPADLNAGVVIVQHIASGFTLPLAERLDSLSKIKVREAKDGMPIRPGEALIAPAGIHLHVASANGSLVIRLTQEPVNALHHPSADVLFQSIAKCCPKETCAVIMTGMGDDGARGMLAIQQAGGWTIAQDEATSVIYGMPRKAVAYGGVSVSLPLDQIAAGIVQSTA